MIMAIIFSVGAVVLAYLISRNISNPLKTLSATMDELAKGNLDIDVPERERGDEVGQMANAVQIFKDHELDRIRLAEALPEQERALAESERRLRSLVRNIPGVPMRTLADAARTVDFVSDHLEQVTGYSAKDFVANKERGFASLLHPEDAAEYKRAIADAVAKQQTFAVEYRIMHKDGTPRFIAEKGQAVPGQKGNVAFIDSHLVDRFAEEK